MVKKFNWEGITENSDGTFTAESKRAKTRLLKEFHKQGVAIRSKKIEGDGYMISPVGEITKKRVAKRPALGYRPRTVYPRRTAHPMMYRAPPRVGVRPMYPQRPGYAPVPRVRRPGALSRVGSYIKRKEQEKMERYQKQVELKQSLRESTAKMKAEREAEIIRNQKVQREIRARVAGKRAAPQITHSQQPPVSTRIPENAGATTTYQTGTGQKVTTHYKPQVDPGTLQAAREKQVIGE